MTQLAGSLLPPPGAVPLAAQLLRDDSARLNPPPLTEQQQRAQFTDFAIERNRANVPDAIKRIIAERRQTTRLTIRDIHGLSEAALQDVMGPRHDTDFRSPIVRVLDVIDLPRNSIANVAFGDPNPIGLLGGLAETAGIFAGAGAIFGGVATGPLAPLGAAGGAVVGAIGGAAVFLVGTALAGITRAFGGDEILSQRLDLFERGAFGQPKLFASDVLEQLGVENKVVRAIVGFGGDVLLDPLTYLGGGGSAIRLSSVGGGKGINFFLRSPAHRVLRPLAAETLAAGPRVGTAIGSSHPLAVLFEKSEAFGNFFGDSTNGVNRLGQLLQDSRQNLAAFNAGQLGAVSFKKNQQVLTNQLLQEIAFFAGTDLRGRPALDLLKQRAAQEFVREFSQRSALNISFPFAGMIANRFHSVLGGRSLQIPVGRVGKAGKVSKALGESPEAFAARIAADADATITAATTQLEDLTRGINLVGPATPDVANALPLELQAVTPSHVGQKTRQKAADRGIDASEIERVEAEIQSKVGVNPVGIVETKIEADGTVVITKTEGTEAGLTRTDVLDATGGLTAHSRSQLDNLTNEQLAHAIEVAEEAGEDSIAVVTGGSVSVGANRLGEVRHTVTNATLDDAKQLLRDRLSSTIELPISSITPGLRDELVAVHGFEIRGELDLAKQDELVRTIQRFDESDRIEQIAQQQIKLVRFTGAVEDETKLLNALKARETDPNNLSVFFDKVNDNLDRLIGNQEITQQELRRLQTPQVLDALDAADNIISATSRGDMLTSYRGFAGAFRRIYSDRFHKIAALYRSKEAISNVANLKARNYIVGKDEAIKRLKILDPEGVGMRTVDNLAVKMTDLHDDVSSIQIANANAAAGVDAATAIPTAPRILSRLPDPSDVPYKAPNGQTVILNFEDPLDYFAWLLRKANRGKDALTKSQRKEAALYLRRVFGADPLQKAKAGKAGVAAINPDKIADKVLSEVEGIVGKVTEGKKAKKPKKVAAEAEEFDEIIEIPSSEGAIRRRTQPLNEQQRARIASETNIQFSQISEDIKAARVIEDDVVLAQTSIKELDDVADAELANLTGQIEELEGKLFWRNISRLATIQASLRDTLNIGRKLKQANEPIRAFRVANENVLPQKITEVTRAFHARMRLLQKRSGSKIASEDWSLAVRGKMQELIEKESAAAVAADTTGTLKAKKGFPEGHDIFVDNFNKRIRDNPNYRTADGSNMLLDSPELNELAEEGIDIMKRMRDVELDLGLVPKDFDATWVYFPLRLADKAQEVARRLGIESGDIIAVGGSSRRISTKQPADLRRLSNRRPYAGDIDPRARMADRADGNLYIFEGELMHHDPLDTKWAYEIERQAYIGLNFDQSNMLPGDLWDRGFKSNPRADVRGPRWHPDAYATSPEELNLRRHDFMRRVGEEITGPIFETDFLTALATRLGEHLRAISAANLSLMVAPHVRTVPLDRMKFLPKGLIGNTKVIDGVEMRAINPAKVGNHNLLKIPLPDVPPGTTVLWPEDLASAIEDFASQYKTDADVNKLLQAMDFVLTGWKASVLLKPAWAMVNIIGGAVLAGLAGIRFNEVPKLMAQLTPVNLKVHGLSRTQFSAIQNIPVGNQLLSQHNIWEQAVEDGIASASRTTQELVPWAQMGTPESKTFFGQLLHKDEGQQAHWLMRVLGKWFQVNAALDDQWRLATWVDLRNQGFSRADATSKVHRYLFDWSDFTRAEREWGPRVWPFYRWMRSNIAIQMKTVLEKPQFAAAFPKILEGLEEALVDEEAIPPHMRPRWMRDAMAIHISANPKTARFLLMGSLTPAQEIFEIGAGVMGQEGFGDFMNYFVSSSNPLAKFAFEIAAGVNIFTGQGIGDPSLGETSVAEHLGRQTGTIGALFRGVFHPVSTAERIIDDPVRETIRFLVGGRFQQKDISSLVAQKRYEEGETLDTLRAGIKRAQRDDDQEEAERLAREAIDRYHMMYNLGYIDFPPKFLQSVFRREQFLKAQQQQASQ